jgi:hypothetical protein
MSHNGWGANSTALFLRRAEARLPSGDESSDVGVIGNRDHRSAELYDAARSESRVSIRRDQTRGEQKSFGHFDPGRKNVLLFRERFLSQSCPGYYGLAVLAVVESLVGATGSRTRRSAAPEYIHGAAKSPWSFRRGTGQFSSPIGIDLCVE